MPQPASFGEQSVEAQGATAGSTLELYRSALRLRRTMPELAENALAFGDAAAGILSFDRGDGFRCLVNFTDTPQPLPAATIILASDAGTQDKLPPNSTVWLSTTASD